VITEFDPRLSSWNLQRKLALAPGIPQVPLEVSAAKSGRTSAPAPNDKDRARRLFVSHNFGANSIQPILRWAGSKKRSLPHLLEFSPKSFGKYVEPFAGSACLFFKLCPQRAVLGDTNPHLIEFYDAIRESGARVFDRFAKIERSEKVYYEIRDLYAVELSPIKRAAYFLYLNRNCFNGIFRVNKKGKFNVPFSASRVPQYQLKKIFLGSVEQLRTATLDCTDFSTLCESHVRKGDFVYLDPPYYVPDQRVFAEYVPHQFALADVERLVEVLNLIDSRGAKFLMNYPDCGMMRRISRRWNRQHIRTRRTIASQVASRGYTSEILIYNFEQ
jgi:DNA adenine methylase